MFGEAIVLAALGIMATITAALVWLLKKLFTQNDTTLREGNKVSLRLSMSIDKLAAASEEQIKATRERTQKDQRWQELVIKKLDHLDVKADRNHDAIIDNQVVKKQTVKHQTVQSQE